MFRITVTIDSVAFSDIKRLVKAGGLKMGKGKSRTTKGMDYSSVITDEEMTARVDISNEAISEIVDFVIRYRDCVVDSCNAIYHAVKGLMSLSKLMDKDFRSIERKYFTRQNH